MHRWGWIAAAVLVVTACSGAQDAEEVGRTGVASAEGELVVVWGSCGDSDVASVALWEGDIDGTPLGEWSTGERNRQESLLVPAAFDDPPQLEDGRSYVARARTADDAEELAPVTFTPEAVAELAPGEVVLGDDPGADPGTLEDLSTC